MAATLRLTVMTGPHKDAKFCFRSGTSCLLGRGTDCFVQLSGTERDQLISRQHCQLKIALPAVQIRDLGSRNGTFLNGHAIDTLEIAVPPCACDERVTRPAEMLTVGGTTLRVDVVDCEGAGGAEWQASETARKGCPTCNA
jgi:pSer/pThr/pTyr-binding forkhead associated (FHA) protein